MTGKGKLAMTLDLAESLVTWGWERKASRTAFEGPSLTKALPGGWEERRLGRRHQADLGQDAR